MGVFAGGAASCVPQNRAASEHFYGSLRLGVHFSNEERTGRAADRE
jgi:hypothetical protein